MADPTRRAVHDVARFFLYPRWTARFKPVPREPAPGAERWAHESEAGPVEALFLPADGAGPTTPRPLVVFCHGNGEVIDLWPHRLAPYRRLGLHVLLPEYRGYGRSAGRPSEAAITADAAALLERALAREDVDPRRLVVHGRSLGGGVACALARRRAPAALVLQSTFTRVPDVARRWGVPVGWHGDVWDNLSAVAALTCPVYVVHGAQDPLIPVAHARRLAEAAGARATLRVERGVHDPFPRDWGAFFADLERFLAAAGVVSPR